MERDAAGKVLIDAVKETELAHNRMELRNPEFIAR
jgi:hypothetical protein